MSVPARCPTCSRPVSSATAELPSSFPFCSPRCRNRDLGAWMAGRYAVAGDEVGVLDSEQSERLADRDHP